ncbi:uncharacterized protein At4g08330, chloroplastic-like [Phoenix dactylifera]|uniref:Uncharacterized protein At4g08330, chloroplastic-like n=1 Tax=Phoenix dactylifera TaxID=42345 RepID=A0A8B7C7M3_PHODC|nr:uncharacterized protein At4g08330, chloroplastic-like [Phoenix dactylifera]
MFFQESYQSQTPPTTHPLSSHRDVTYSCGSCGFALNLSSSNRNTTSIGSKYGKAIKKGVVSFFSIDESRFSQADELLCLPCSFNSKHSWGLFGRRTRLLCRKCGTFIGSASPIGPNSCRKYSIKISALQPSSADESPVPPPRA